ncbi:MAG: hypothetical protein NVSMB40_13350 [Aquirhabdus sp.]
MDQRLEEILAKELAIDKLIYIRQHYSDLFSDRQEQLSFLKALASMHNNNRIDLIEVFAEILNLGKQSFFTYQHIWSELLEYLNSPISQLFDLCVVFHKESGADLMAWACLNALEKFCASDKKKANELFSIITTDPKKYKTYLTLGLRIVSKHDFTRARNYIISDMLLDKELIVESLFSIGRLHYPDIDSANHFIEILEKYSLSATDECLARILDSACSIFLNNSTTVDLFNLIEKIQSNPNIGNHTAFSASQHLFQNGKSLPEQIVERLISFIKLSKETDLNTLHNFGYFFIKSIDGKLFSLCLDVLEHLLVNINEIKFGFFVIN